MARFSLGSLRVRLILLVLLAVLPAFGLSIYGGIQERRRAMAEAQTQALILAKTAANLQDNLIEEGRTLLFTLSLTPQVQARDRDACNTLFARLLEQKARYTAIAAYTAEGQSFACAPPLTKTINVSDRPWYRRLMETRDFTVTEYLLGRATGQAVVCFCYPVLNSDRQVTTILLAALNLSWLQQFIANLNIPSQATMTIVDRNGTVLARHPDPEHLLGQTLPEVPLIKTMLHDREGVTSALGLDGKPRIFGFTTLAPADGGVYIAVGLPESEVFAGARRQFIIHLGSLGLVLVFVLVAARVGGDLFVRRQVTELLDITQQLGKGDLTAHTGPPYRQGELGQLARAFDSMAASLQEREAQRRQAEEGLKLKELMLDGASDSIFLHNRDGHLLYVNEAACKDRGYDKEEMLGKNLTTILSPEFDKISTERFPELLDRGEIFFESEHLRKDGSVMPVEVHARMFYFNSHPTILSVARDITKRKLTETALKNANEYLENIFSNSADGIGIVDQHGNFQRWNKAAEDIYGYNFEELSGKPAADLYADQSEFQRMLKKLRHEGFVKNYEINMRKKDGTIFPASLSIGLLHHENDVIGSVAIARDLTETKNMMMQLQVANEKLQVLVEEATRRNHEVVLINRMVESLQSCLLRDEAFPIIVHFLQQIFERMSGALFIQKTSANLLEEVAHWGDPLVGKEVWPPDDCWAIRRGRIHLSKSSNQWDCCRHLPAQAPGFVLCTPLIAQGETLGLLQVQTADEIDASLIDRTKDVLVRIGDNLSLALANISLRETLHHQVTHDPLTGLFNRRYLDETLGREIARVYSKKVPLGIIMLDLDHFKRFNDTYGHEAGDSLLEVLGKFLGTQVKQEGMAYRYSGEEFILILPEAHLDVIQKRAEEIRQGVSQLRVHHRGRVLEMPTISLGVAIFPNHGTTAEDLLRAVDDAMHRAKAAGRNRVVVAESIDASNQPSL